MRRIIGFGLGTALAGLTVNVSGFANAADLRLAMPVKAPMQAATDWSGFYVGLGVGMRSTQPDVRMSDITINGTGGVTATCAFLASLGGCVTSQPLNDTALRASFYSGFNWQIAPQWVVGAEGDYGYADKTTTLRGMEYPVSTRLTGSAADSFSARPRPMPRSLPSYSTAPTTSSPHATPSTFPTADASPARRHDVPDQSLRGT